MGNEKKSLIISGIIFIIILLSGLTAGLILLFLNNISNFLYTFLISYPFLILTFISLKFTYKHFDNTSKGKIYFLIGYIIRFISIIGALGFSLLFLNFNGGLASPNIFYIFIPVTLFTIGYIVGVIFR